MPSDFQRWTAVNAAGQSRYDLQSRIIGEVLATPNRALDRLLERMRSSGESCLYLSGSRLDNDFAFGSLDLGLAISVLPEDGAKAAVPAYHPGGTELYVVIQGTLVLETLVDGALDVQTCDQHAVATIPAGQCHRVRRSPTQAASLVVKTALRHEPAVVRCADCTYYPDREHCPLRRSWVSEDPRAGA